MVHGDSLIDGDGKLDSTRLDLENLDRFVGQLRFMQTNLIFAERPPQASLRLLKMAIVGWEREANVAPNMPSTHIGDTEWKAAVRLTGGARGFFVEEADEDAVGDDVVRVYPVRTALSRLMSGEADCVVSLRRPFGEDANGRLDEKTRGRVKELVESLKLKQRTQIQFAIRLGQDVNHKAVDEFKINTARELAKELGFENFSVTQDDAR